MRYLAAGLLAFAAAACGSFEDPAIVLDLRTLAIVASPPEYIIPFDPENPPDPSELQLPPCQVHALVADPGETRALDWEMTLCPANLDDGRCRSDHPAFVIGAGTIADPDLDPSHEVPFATFTPDASTYLLLQDAIELDPLAGFSGIDLQVELRVAPAGTRLADGVVATKRIRFAAQVPLERTANTNPWLTQVDWDTGGPEPMAAAMPLGRCVDLASTSSMMTIATDEILYLFPQEPAGVREDYVVPTFDGGFRMFTENLSYQWLAGDGEFQPPFTGGPKDPFGNNPPLHTEWTPPTNDDLGDRDFLDVPMWVVQRDERLGAAWFESCVRVAKN